MLFILNRVEKMKLLINAALSLCGILGFGYNAYSQITKEQTRLFDSVSAHTHLVAPVIHNFNINPTPNGPIITRDHANGFYAGNANLTIGLSNTVDVLHYLAKEINSVQGMAYKSADLDLMFDPQAYEDSVLNWFSSLGIPVGIHGIINPEARFFPNPLVNYGSLNALIPEGKNAKIFITDIQGKIVRRIGKDSSGQIDTHLPKAASSKIYS